MPIDASIYGNVQLPKLATLGEIAEARAQREDRQMVRDSRKLTLEKQQREAKELQAIQEVFTKYTGPDGPDQTAIVNELFRIAPEAAQKVQSGFVKLKKEASDARSSELDAETKRIAAVSRSLQGVTPETYPAAFSRIRVIDPEAAEVLGPTYDPAKVDAVMSSGMAWSDYNAKYKDVLKRQDDDEVKALNLISLANDQNQYEDALDFAKVHGVASKLREMGFTDQFTPDVAARAGQLTMTPEKRATMAATASENEANRALTRRGQDLSAATQRRGQDLTDARAKAETGGGADTSGLVEAILKNPSTYNDLTPSVKTKLIGALADRGFNFAKAGAGTKAAGPDAARIFGEISTLSKRINTTGGGLGSVVTGLARQGAAKAQYDNDVSEYEALVSGMIPMVARAVGHTGVLTQQDVDSVRALFPRTGDNKTLAENKLARVNRILGSGAAPSADTAAPAGKSNPFRK